MRSISRVPIEDDDRPVGRRLPRRYEPGRELHAIIGREFDDLSLRQSDGGSRRHLADGKIDQAALAEPERGEHDDNNTDESQQTEVPLAIRGE